MQKRPRRITNVFSANLGSPHPHLYLPAIFFMALPENEYRNTTDLFELWYLVFSMTRAIQRPYGYQSILLHRSNRPLTEYFRVAACGRFLIYRHRFHFLQITGIISANTYAPAHIKKMLGNTPLSDAINITHAAIRK